MHILEGEALLNDASSLVCFRFAVVAALTGSFSLASASWQFVLVAGGGIVVGAAISWGVNFANTWLVRMAGEDRSEEHTSELQSLMRISYAVFCLKKKKRQKIRKAKCTKDTH